MCQLESISLKEINNRTLVSDSFELSLRCYWWIKLHSSTPNISISTLLNIILARMLLVSNISVFNEGFAWFLVRSFVKDLYFFLKKRVPKFMSNSKLSSQSASVVNLFVKHFYYYFFKITQQFGHIRQIWIRVFCLYISIVS